MAKRKAPKGYKKAILTDSALKVLKERYLAKDSAARPIETPEGMFYRVAKAVAENEKNYGFKEEQVELFTRKFYDLMAGGIFLPNSPTLMNAGKGNDLQYSGCFVLPVEDSLEGIFESVKNAALIHKSGGGTGFSFSRLRPKGAAVSSTSGVASGPVSFMRVFVSASGEVKQGGTRRGANMGVLRVDHPDIEEFIQSKAEGGITNFNISVAVTDEFLKAYKQGKSYWLIDPSTKKRVRKVQAKLVFDKIVDQAWSTGDPGVVFIDRINDSPANPVPSMGPIESTNPCGEQPLYPNESCNLGSINLALMGTGKKGRTSINWEKLKEATRLAVRFLDDVIDINPFPLKEITQMVLKNRRVGLGVMGWADLLFQLEMPYNSEKAFKLGEKIMTFIQKQAHLASQELAKEKGAFPTFDKSIYRKGPALRNATLTTIAPTGSISIIAGCSSGIEPLFALCFKHKSGDRELTFVNPYFKEALKRYRAGSKIMKEIEEKGTLHDVKGIPSKLKEVYVTAHEISWRDHIKMQAVFQKGTDNAVSKTINLPNQAGREEIKKAYLYAYKSGCMGVTVFRDGCRSEQVLYSGVKEEKKKEEKQEERQLTLKPRPKIVSGQTYRVETPVGTAFVTVNTNGGSEPLEVFVNVGKAGSDIAADAEAIGRLISLNLRLGSIFSAREVLAQIIDQLEGIGGGESVGFGPNKVRSLADGVARVLAEYAQSGEKDPKEAEVSLESQQLDLLNQKKRRDLCPKCGRASLIFEEGCSKCLYCGYNKC